MKRVAVLTGGSTAERHVALAGAAQVVGSLRRSGFDVVVVDTVTGPVASEREPELLIPSVGRDPPTPDQMDEWLCREREFDFTRAETILAADVVFLILHGNQGEGGDVQRRLAAAGIRFTGSDEEASRVAMDKMRSKEVWSRRGIPTPAGYSWPAEPSELEELGLPVIVKPSRVGSTVGLTLLRDLEGLEAALTLARKYDDLVLVEEFLDGREFTVGVLGDDALAVGEIVPQHEIFDYECKYTPGMTDEIFPARIGNDLIERLQTLALEAHRSLGLRHFSRVDFKLDSEGEPRCLEANTLPGLTATSLLPQSAAAANVDFDELCKQICHLALT